MNNPPKPVSKQEKAQ